MGKEGVADTPLRPSGTGVFGEERISVLAQGVFIEKGSKIKITEIAPGRKVKVKQI